MTEGPRVLRWGDYCKETRRLFIATNNFKVVPGREADFETAWKSRESYLKGTPGFIRFALLRGEGGEYISHSTWETKDAFLAWTQSPAFAAGHRQGSLAGVLAGPPAIKTYETVIVEDA
jgi:heme-degrading monooxygenase HmoA